MSEEKKTTGSAITWNEQEIKTAYQAANIGASLKEQFKALFAGLDKTATGTDAYKLRFKAIQHNATAGYFIKRMFPGQGADYTEEQELKAKALVLKEHGKCLPDEKAQRNAARQWVFDGLKKAEIESPFAKGKKSQAEKDADAQKKADAAETTRKESIDKAVQGRLRKVVTKLPDHVAFIHALERNAQVMLQLITMNNWVTANDPARKLVERFASDLAKLLPQEIKQEKLAA